MLDLAVRDDDLRIGQDERGISKLQCVRVKEDRMLLPAHGRSELIHDAAVHADIDVLRPLAEYCQILLLHVIKGKELSQDETREHFQRGGRGQAGAGRDIS